MSSISVVSLATCRTADLAPAAATPPPLIEEDVGTEVDPRLRHSVRAARHAHIAWTELRSQLFSAKPAAGEEAGVGPRAGRSSSEGQGPADLAVMQWRRQTAADALVESLSRLTNPTADEHAAGDALLAKSDSHSVFYSNVIQLIESLDLHWLSMYEDALSGYIKFFERLTSIMALEKDAISGTDDKGNLIVDFSAVRNGLSQLVADLDKIGSGLVSFSRRADAESLVEELGLSCLKVRSDGKGGYEVHIDRNAIIELRDTLPQGKSTIDPARHSAIISAKDSLMERFNHANMVLSDKYKYQMQVWDTLVRALSSSIEAMDEAQRTFIHNL